MTAGQWQRLESIFHRSLAVGLSQRERFLNDECGADTVLRGEVASLLAAHDRDHSALASPTAGAIALLLRSEPQLAPGTRLAQYEVVRHLDSGGMSEVYEAMDNRLGRRVAIKMLPSMPAAPDVAVRFRREARILASLNHPNIVTVFDFGESDGRLYLVTELIQGRTLRDRIAGGPIPVAEAVNVAQQIARALSFAHAAGVIHRDIKPENVMLREDGYVRVVDFGLAREQRRPVSNQSNATEPGTVLGTCRYMSPEQVRGEEAGQRTDLWSLGVVLYEMVSGQPPFDGPTASHIAVNILESAPGAIPETLQHTPLNTLIVRALEKDVDRRIATAVEFEAGLTASPQPSGRRRQWRLSKRLVWAFVVVCLATAAAGLWRRMIGVSHRVGYGQMTYLTRNGKVGWATVSPDGKSLAYTVNSPGRQSLRMVQVATHSEIELAPPSRNRYQGVTFAPDSNYVYYVCYGATNLGILYRIPAMGGEPRPVADDVDSPVTFAPDGKKFAFIRNAAGSTKLVVRDFDGKERILLQRPAASGFSRAGLSWSPDGETIAIVARDLGLSGPLTYYPIQIRVSDGRPARLPGGPWRWAGRITWTRGGNWLIVNASDGIVGVRAIGIPRTPGAATVITPDVSDYYEAAVTNADDLMLVRDETVSRVEIAKSGSSSPSQIGPASGQYRGVSWTADGQLLTQIVSQGRRQLWLVRTDGTGRQITEDDSDKVDGAACGSAIVYSANFAGTYAIWRIDTDGRNARQLAGGAADNVSPGCTPDGQTVFYESRREGQFELWRVPASGGAAARVTSAIARSPALSPDGSRVACELNVERKWRVAILGLDGSLERYVDRIPPGSRFQWDPTGRGLTFVDTRDEASNIWAVDLDGKSEKQITAFNQDQIFNHAWSRSDGALALIRGSSNNDVVLMKAR